jgi:hypothetical protein
MCPSILDYLTPAQRASIDRDKTAQQWEKDIIAARKVKRATYDLSTHHWSDTHENY